MSTLNDNDLFVYQDSTTGNVGTVSNSNRSSLQDDDLFVVQAAADGQVYSVKASDVSTGGGALPTIETAVLAEVTPDTPERFTNQSFTVTTNVDVKAAEPITYKYKAEVNGELTKQLETDTITAVSQNNIIYSDGVRSAGTITKPLENPEKAFDGTGFTQSSADMLDMTVAPSGKLIFNFDEPFTDVTSVEVWTYSNPSAGTTREIRVIDDNGNVSKSTIPDGQPQRYKWQVATVPANGTVAEIEVYANNTVTNGEVVIPVSGIKINGNILIDGEAGAVLTLASDKDLANFETGDAVTMSGGVDTSLTITDVDNTADAWVRVDWQGWTQYSNNSSFFTLNILSDTSASYTTSKDVYMQNSQNWDAAQNGWILPSSVSDQYCWMEYTTSGSGSGTCGDSTSANNTMLKWYRQQGGQSYRRVNNGTNAWENLTAGTNECKPGWNKVTEQFSNGITIHGLYVGDENRNNLRRIMYTSATATEENGGLATILTFADNTNFQYYNVGDEIQTGIFILELDPDNNQMKITAGSGLVVGDSINSPNSPPPITGVVATTSGVTMTLSSASGTWETGRTAIGPTKTIQDTNLWCVLNGDGEVQGLQSAEPEGQQIVPGGGTTFETRTIKFPDFFRGEYATGQTPDETLPEGTSIKAYVETVNVSGSDTKVTNTVTPIANPGPNATMHGLRFDSSRKTNLSRVLAPVTDFTLSAWVKNTGDAVEAMILGQKVESAAEFISYYINKSSRNLTLFEKPDNKSLGTNVSVPLNQWTHVLFKCESNVVTGYVNGVAANSPVTLTKGYQVDRFAIGRALSDDTNYMDGYMSDIYFVDGQALEPTTFGADFEGKWGPLDSSVVNSNIKEAFPDDQYNTDEVWSSTIIANASYNKPASAAFDGNQTTNLELDGGSPGQCQLNIPGPFTNVTSIELLGRVEGSGSNTYTVSGNGFTTVDDWANMGALPLSLTITSSTVSDITITSDNETSGVRLAYVKINGRILVDAGFGANSFYLPFDPAAQGVNYTAGIVSTLVNATQVYGTFTGGGFDGRAGDLAANASNLFGSQTTGSQSGNLVVPINKSYSSSIKMYGYQNTNGTITLRIDGVDYNSGLGTSVDGKNLPLTTISGIPASGTLESITVTQSNFTGATGFTGIYLDDVLLVNHNNIGVDASGNSNNFTDQGFAVGDADKNWSSTFISSTGFRAGEEGVNAFDGDVGSGVGASASRARSVGDGIITWDVSKYNLSGTFEVKSASSRSVIIDGVLFEQQGMDANGEWRTITDSLSNPNTIIFTGNTGDLSNDGLSGAIVYGIRVNGKLLIDANIADTVLDTPMNSYAVLTAGANGNLEATGVSNVTYMGEAGTDYYYEAEGAGAVHTGGATFSSVSGKTYNFGQQPFASQFDTSQVWSSGGEANFTPSDVKEDWQGMFDGNEATRLYVNTSSDAQTFTVTFTPALQDVTSLTQLCSGQNGKITANSNTTIVNPSAIDWSVKTEQNILSTLEGSTTLSSLTYTAGPYDASFGNLKVNGKILVDTDAAIAEAYGNNLVQTWLEWNDVAVLRSGSPEDVAKFNAIKAALEAYEGDCVICKQNLGKILIDVVASGVLSNDQEETLAKLIRINQ